jgi:hypothetical protein
MPKTLLLEDLERLGYEDLNNVITYLLDLK